MNWLAENLILIDTYECKIVLEEHANHWHINDRYEES
jgi:hypothetical protein